MVESCCPSISTPTACPNSRPCQLVLQAGSRQGSFPALPKLARPPSFGSVPVTPNEKSPHGSESARSAPRLSKLESMASTAVRAAAKIQVQPTLQLQMCTAQAATLQSQPALHPSCLS